jgi:hypothetical protein
MFKKGLFGPVSAGGTEYSVLAEYSAEYLADTFGRTHVRSDTRVDYTCAWEVQFGCASRLTFACVFDVNFEFLTLKITLKTHFRQ